MCSSVHVDRHRHICYYICTKCSMMINYGCYWLCNRAWIRTLILAHTKIWKKANWDLNKWKSSSKLPTGWWRDSKLPWCTTWIGDIKDVDGNNTCMTNCANITCMMKGFQVRIPSIMLDTIADVLMNAYMWRIPRKGYGIAKKACTCKIDEVFWCIHVIEYIMFVLRWLWDNNQGNLILTPMI